jgi:hypothetical protein
MKRRILFFLLVVALGIGVAGDSGGQLFKKKPKKNTRREMGSEPTGESKKERKRRKKEEKRREREERKARKKKQSKKEHSKKKKKKGKQRGEGIIKESPSARKPSRARQAVAFQYPATQIRARYRVDLLAPLYLDEFVKNGSATSNKIPDKAMPGAAFYQGVKLAADSLKRAGFNIDIYVHDVTSAEAGADVLVAKNKLDSSDLIIGAILPADIPEIAAYAKKKRINFVSALSPVDAGVKDNPYFTLIQPTLRSHCEWILNDAAAKYPGQKVGLLYRTSLQVEENAHKYLTEAGNTSFVSVQCNTLPDEEVLAARFGKNMPSVVVVAILETAYADSVLKMLGETFPGTHFEVYGMPSWVNLGGLHKESAYPNLSIHITQPFNFEASAALKQRIDRSFKKEYGSKPIELVFRGYETMLWYADLLRKYGTVFNGRYSDVSGAPFTRFNIKPEADDDDLPLYNENKHLYLSTYEDGVLKTETE